MVLKELILTVSTLEGVAVLKELILTVFSLGFAFERTDFTSILPW